MTYYDSTLINSITYWNILPSEVFISLYAYNKKEIILIKFRETISKRTLFNEIEPWDGIKFIDTIGSKDYFLGEFVIIDKSIWSTIVASQAVILKPKRRVPRLKEQKVRDDGFIKTYFTNNSFIMTKV